MPRRLERLGVAARRTHLGQRGDEALDLRLVAQRGLARQVVGELLVVGQVGEGEVARLGVDVVALVGRLEAGDEAVPRRLRGEDGVLEVPEEFGATAAAAEHEVGELAGAREEAAVHAHGSVALDAEASVPGGFSYQPGSL